MASTGITPSPLPSGENSGDEANLPESGTGAPEPSSAVEAGIPDGSSPSTAMDAALEQQQQDDTDHAHYMSGTSIGLSIDSDDSDVNSSLGNMDSPSSSMSVSSSVYHFVEEFGRTYHSYKEGKYYLPNDEQEQDRLDLQHALALRLLDGKLHLAPVGKPNRVLDIGTGTGIWAMQFADEHPEADVLGIDLSPIQSPYVPPNCRFEIDDAEDNWVYNYKFDYIHGRYICPFLADVPKMLERIYENLNPGGYVEIMETLMLMEAVDNSLDGHPLQRWASLMVGGIRTMGKDPLSAVNCKRWMVEAGFVDVTEKKFAVPANPWARGAEQKVRGAMMMANLLEVAQGITMNVFTKVLGWSTEEVELFLVDIRAGLKDRRVHGYVPVLCIWGQKPIE